MQEKLMVNILRCNQHDLMNDLQVIQGYLSMDKVDKVKEKVTDLIDHYHEKRKLINTNAPYFILWVIQFGHTYDNIQLSYCIDTENVDLSKVDVDLIEDCKYIVNQISRLGSNTELYRMNLHLKKESHKKITVELRITGQLDEEKEFRNLGQNKRIYIKKSENGMTCELSYII
jgi:stage 0 sporulation protein B (sporulation initiation phosphotransferase)